MKIYRKEYKQLIKTDLNTAWQFFSSPHNLAKITPKDMAFVVTSPQDNLYTMYPGLIICYKVSPLFGIKLSWVTEITHVQEKTYFVDEQRFGPYALWHHYHYFEATEKGVLMTDILHYAIPYGIIGRMANAVLVENKIEEIFEYRRKAVDSIFP